MSAAVEIPAYVFVWLTLRFLRRRLSITGILLLAAVSLVSVQLVPESTIMSWFLNILETYRILIPIKAPPPLLLESVGAVLKVPP